MSGGSELSWSMPAGVFFKACSQDQGEFGAAAFEFKSNHGVGGPALGIGQGHGVFIRSGRWSWFASRRARFGGGNHTLQQIITQTVHIGGITFNRHRRAFDRLGSCDGLQNGAGAEFCISTAAQAVDQIGASGWTSHIISGTR